MSNENFYNPAEPEWLITSYENEEWHYKSRAIMAVLGGCARARNQGHEGEFWWHLKSTPYSNSIRGYADTVIGAKQKVEEYFAEACQNRQTKIQNEINKRK